MLHHNLPFLRLADHHKNSAVYEPLEDSPRQVVLTLVNILLEQSRSTFLLSHSVYLEQFLLCYSLNAFDTSAYTPPIILDFVEATKSNALFCKVIYRGKALTTTMTIFYA